MMSYHTITYYHTIVKETNSDINLRMGSYCLYILHLYIKKKSEFNISIYVIFMYLSYDFLLLKIESFLLSYS